MNHSCREPYNKRSNKLIELEYMSDIKNNKDMLDKINKIIDQLRPFLQSDGGDMEVIEITDDNVVKVKLIGACGDCPFSAQTLKAGVEQALKKEIPEIKEVVAV
jgi:Fe-S cluster biogenesis protein NfuA